MSNAQDNSDMTPTDELRDRILALQRSAANMVNMDLEQLRGLLPPGTSRERVLEIRSKILQLHLLQNSRENAQDSDTASSSADWPTTHRSSRYKTELCRPYEEDGVCKYGARCQFAHGHSELRNLPRHPKYKSQLCRTFHSNGLCPYGHRCHFIHNQDEARGDASPRHVNGAQTDATYNDFNMNNVQIHEPVPDRLVNEWSHQPSFPNFSYEIVRQPLQNSVVQSYMPGPGPTTASMMPQTMISTFNGNKPLPTGAGLGSVAELTPPISPLIFSTEEGFLSQTPIRQGYFSTNRAEDFPELDLTKIMAEAKISDPVEGSSLKTSVRKPKNNSLKTAENARGSDSPLGRDDRPW